MGNAPADVGSPYSVEDAADPNVVIVRVEHPDNMEWRQSFLLVSDVHFDSPHCDRQLLKRHLDEAVEMGAGILSIGDWFDAMQGRDDPRRNKGAVRPEYGTDTYIDDIVTDSARFLEPYKTHLVMLADGNHETSVRKKIETDLTGRLATRLGVKRMGYSGFVRFQFHGGGKNSKPKMASHVLYFHHGSGGGGPVTRGTIQTNRRAVFLPDASIVVSGHIHESWQLVVPRLRLNRSNRIVQDEQTHVQLATYKQEYDSAGGWHVERGAPPKPLGGAWLTFRYERNTGGRYPSNIVHTVRRAT